MAAKGTRRHTQSVQPKPVESFTRRIDTNSCAGGDGEGVGLDGTKDEEEEESEGDIAVVAVAAEFGDAEAEKDEGCGDVAEEAPSTAGLGSTADDETVLSLELLRDPPLACCLPLGCCCLSCCCLVSAETADGFDDADGGGVANVL